MAGVPRWSGSRRVMMRDEETTLQRCCCCSRSTDATVGADVLAAISSRWPGCGADGVKHSRGKGARAGGMDDENARVWCLPGASVSDSVWVAKTRTAGRERGETHAVLNLESIMHVRRLLYADWIVAVRIDAATRLLRDQVDHRPTPSFPV